MDSEITFCIKWNGKEYSIGGLEGGQTVENLKEKIAAETGVLPPRQKLLGLKCKAGPPSGKAAVDSTLLSDLVMKPNQKIMMMGTREETIAVVEKPPEDMPEVLNDFDIEEEEIAIENRSEYLAKIEKRIADYKIEVMNEPREGKKLLVLDIDYTLFDHKSVGETGRDLMRPYLHEFLASAYTDYDIVIWSATSMKWIKAKMEELNVVNNPLYKLCFMVDSGAMITVQSPKYGIIEVKPLGVIWGKYPQWSAKNTIMFDDIRRNFIMNPQSGLKIRPFRQAHLNRDKDKELFYLSAYLKDISVLEDFSSLNHKYWESYRPKKHRRHHESSGS